MPAVTTASGSGHCFRDRGSLAVRAAMLGTSPQAGSDRLSIAPGGSDRRHRLGDRMSMLVLDDEDVLLC